MTTQLKCVPVVRPGVSVPLLGRRPSSLLPTSHRRWWWWPSHGTRSVARPLVVISSACAVSPVLRVPVALALLPDLRLAVPHCAVPGLLAVRCVTARRLLRGLLCRLAITGGGGAIARRTAGRLPVALQIGTHQRSKRQQFCCRPTSVFTRYTSQDVNIRISTSRGLHHAQLRSGTSTHPARPAHAEAPTSAPLPSCRMPNSLLQQEQRLPRTRPAPPQAAPPARSRRPEPQAPRTQTRPAQPAAP